MSQTKKKKMLEKMMNQKDDDDDEDDDDNDEEGESDLDESGGANNSNDDDSLLDEDIANRSLNAEDEDQLVVIDNLNYLKYVSEKHNQQTDILEIIDKNERSFKQIAEKMIFQTSYLV